MRQWNQIESMSSPVDAKFPSDHLFKLRGSHKLRDGQSPNWNYETRLENFDFIVHPRRAIANFLRRRDTIAAAGIFSGKTPADCCEINSRSNGCFIHSAEFFKPTKKSFPSGMRERPLQHGFSWAGSLTNNHYVADHGPAGHRGRFHSRAAPALQEMSDMLVELSLNA
jgi:hypothetical protein